MVLKDKTVLVTGSSKGIGRACVAAFAREGAHVIINYAHDRTAADKAAAAASRHGVKTLVVQADIASQTEVGAMDPLDVRNKEDQPVGQSYSLVFSMTEIGSLNNKLETAQGVRQALLEERRGATHEYGRTIDAEFFKAHNVQLGRCYDLAEIGVIYNRTRDSYMQVSGPDKASERPTSSVNLV